MHAYSVTRIVRNMLPSQPAHMPFWSEYELQNSWLYISNTHRQVCVCVCTLRKNRHVWKKIDKDEWRIKRKSIYRQVKGGGGGTNKKKAEGQPSCTKGLLIASMPSAGHTRMIEVPRHTTSPRGRVSSVNLNGSSGSAVAQTIIQITAKSLTNFQRSSHNVTITESKISGC